jgi:heme exporter protein A
LNSAPVLDCQSLAYERDDYPVFEGVSFVVNAGQGVQVQGANGAGKTTLLRLLATSIEPSAGTINWRGEPISRCRNAYRGEMFYLGHQPGVKHALTPRENLAWLLAVHPNTCCDIDETLARVGLSGFEDVPAFQLSAGQLRRIALARLYLSQARLWLLDEPLTAIDKAGVAALETLIADHLARGGMVVLSTHQPLIKNNLQQLDLADYAAVA